MNVVTGFNKLDIFIVQRKIPAGSERLTILSPESDFYHQMLAKEELKIRFQLTGGCILWPYYPAVTSRFTHHQPIKEE